MKLQSLLPAIIVTYCQVASFVPNSPYNTFSTSFTTRYTKKNPLFWNKNDSSDQTSDNNGNDENNNNNVVSNNSLSRRKFQENISKSIVGWMTSMTISTTLLPQKSNAACLAGDTSIDCIGVYKVPIDDNIKYMVSTPEQLAKFAPDLRYVPPIAIPRNYVEAKDELLSLQEDVSKLTSLVSKGELTMAGIEILRTVPRITVTGRVVIATLGKYDTLSMKAYRTDVAHSELLASLGSADVMIGQSIAGQLGSITAAQIQILEELRNANENYDELVKAIPSDFTG